jgi:hypothetical protein
MTFRYLLDNKCSQKCRLSGCTSFLSLTSLFLVLVAASVCPSIARAADEVTTLKSVKTSDPSLRYDSIDWFVDFNATDRRHRDLLPTSPSIKTPSGDAGAFHENEFLPVSGATSTANPSAIFKTDRWRTNKAVIASTIFEAAWLTADGMTTAGMSRGAREVGSTWAYGRHPTPGRTAAMMAAEFVGVEASSYVLHKMKAPKWIYISPMVISGSLHASGAIPSMKIGQ